jgi:HAD superfamily hydrolase (TIGR01509 family)
MKKIKLVIFDMDGLMIDTERMYLETARITAQRLGINFTDEVVYKTIGLSNANAENVYHEILGNDFNYNNFMHELGISENAYLVDHPITKKKGLDELLNYLKGTDIKMAVATSTSKIWAKERLDVVNIYNYFDFIIYGDQLKDSKPNPEIYLKVLEHYNYSSEDAIIFEDSLNGLKAALNANIRCIIIPDLCYIPDEMLEKAYKVYPDLSYGIQLIKENNKL